MTVDWDAFPGRWALFSVGILLPFRIMMMFEEELRRKRNKIEVKANGSNTSITLNADFNSEFEWKIFLCSSLSILCVCVYVQMTAISWEYGNISGSYREDKMKTRNDYHVGLGITLRLISAPPFYLLSWHSILFIPQSPWTWTTIKASPFLHSFALSKYVALNYFPSFVRQSIYCDHLGHLDSIQL